MKVANRVSFVRYNCETASRISRYISRTIASQMTMAGIEKSSSNKLVTDEEKQKLLAHIRSGQTKVKEPAKVTLRRKSTSTIKGGAGAVNVEVRKKRTYVHRDLTAEAEKQREIEGAKLDEDQDAEESTSYTSQEVTSATTVEPE